VWWWHARTECSAVRRGVCAGDRQHRHRPCRVAGVEGWPVERKARDGHSVCERTKMIDVKDTENGSEAAGAASLAGPRRRLEKDVSAEVGRMGRGGGLELTNAQGESGVRGRASTSARVGAARWLTQRTHRHREHTQVRNGASYRTRPASAPCRQGHSRL